MDKRFVDRTVLHKQYGKGIIISTNSKDITVEFANQTMDFHFPDAFQKGTLVTDDADLRAYVQRSVTDEILSGPQGKKQRFGAVPIVFLNVAWMKWYDGVTEDDVPVNGGAFIDENRNGNEVHNFTPYPEENGETGVVSDWLFGSYETKSTNGKSPNQTHIERIAGCQDLAQEGEAYWVLVIWCATAPGGGRRVVGWYRDATVCRYYEPMTVEEDDWHNVFARAEDAVLLSEPERYKEKWSVPGHTREGNTVFGFGQANVWYASEPAAEEYVKQLVKNINEYDGPTFLETYKERFARLDDGTLAELPDYTGMNDARKEAFKTLRLEVLANVKSGDFSRAEQIVWLQEYNSDKDSRKKFTDKQLLNALFEVGAKFIGDDGELYIDQKGTLYEVNGDFYCCGHELDYDEGAKTFTCTVCGNEHEVMKRSD